MSRLENCGLQRGFSLCFFTVARKQDYRQHIFVSRRTKTSADNSVVRPPSNPSLRMIKYQSTAIRCSFLALVGKKRRGCSFLALVGKKRTKETPLKGERCFKTRQNGWWLNRLRPAEFFAILSPLRIPLSSARLRRALVRHTLNCFSIIISEIDLNDGARRRGHTGFALYFKYNCQNDNLSSFL